jgi:hypothetical protein
VKTKQSDAGNLSTDGHLKLEDGATERDGSYNLGQGGGGRVEIDRVANSGSPSGGYQFATLRGGLTSGTTLNGGGSYDTVAGGLSQTAQVDLGTSARLDLTGVEGTFRRTPIMTDGVKTGETWEGSRVTSSEDGNGGGQRGGSITIDPDGTVTATGLTNTEYGGGASKTLHYRFGGSYDTGSDGTSSSSHYEYTDTYTTTTGTSPAAGNRPASQSSADTHAWSRDAYSESILVQTASDLHKTGSRSSSDGRQTQTVTLSGNQASARISSGSSSLDESYDITRTAYEGDGNSYLSWTSTVSRNEGQASSSYSSSHTLDEAGRARGGTFSTRSDERQKAATINVYYESSHFDDPWMGTNNIDDDHTERFTETIRTATESGWYEDLVLPEGGAVRVQSARFHVEDTLNAETIDRFFDQEWDDSGYLSAGHGEELTRHKTVTTTDGSYGPYPEDNAQETAVTRTFTHRLRAEAHQRYGGPEQIGEFDRYHASDLTTHTADGLTTGHERDDAWGWEWPTGNYHETLDRDIFEYEAPPETPIDPPPRSSTPGSSDSLVVPVSDVAPPKPQPKRRDILDDIMRQDGPPLRSGSYMMGHEPTHERAKQFAKELTETQGMIADTLAPGVQGYNRVVNGYDPVRDEEVGTGARWIEGLVTSLPVVAGAIGSKVKAIQKLLPGFDEAEAAAAQAGKVEHGVVAGAKPKAVSVSPKGGAYKDVRKGNIGGEVHHIPADAISPYSRGNGPSVWMDTLDHQQTASWGRSNAAQAYRQQQLDLINQRRLREAMQMDIDDIRSRFGTKYDDHIRQMLDAYGFPK